MENRKDLEEVPDVILKSLEIVPVAQMSDVAGRLFDIDLSADRVFADAGAKSLNKTGE